MMKIDNNLSRYYSSNHERGEEPERCLVEVAPHTPYNPDGLANRYREVWVSHAIHLLVAD